MAPQSIKSQSIIPRRDGIARDRLMLQKLGVLPDAEFSKEENFNGRLCGLSIGV